MTLQELAKKEHTLLGKVIDLHRQPQSDLTNKQLQDVFLNTERYIRLMQIYQRLTLKPLNVDFLSNGMH